MITAAKRDSMRKWLGLVALGSALVGGLLPPTTAHALDDTQQILIGGASGSAGETRFTAPGIATTYTPNSPGTGLGEAAAQIRMVAGTLGKFRVAMVPDPGGVTAGSVTFMVRLNGADTVLTCSVGFAGGDCGSGGQSIDLVNGDKIAVRVVSTLDGVFAYTYTMVYD